MGILQKQLIDTLTLLSTDYPAVKPQIALAQKYVFSDKDPKSLLVVLSILNHTIQETPQILTSPHLKELERITQFHSEHIIISDTPDTRPAKTGKR